ncbi:hypothetical protein ACHAXS_003160, partial [Conticribra weissflogii]
RTRRLSNHYTVCGIVLASGGLAGIYRHFTNSAGFNALGSSVGLALSLNGALSLSIVSDLEYVQFHPTALYLPNEPCFLLTEALRGKGAILRDATGRAFAQEYHHRGDLAPRDIIACAVFCKTQLNDGRAMHNGYLDVMHRNPDTSLLEGLVFGSSAGEAAAGAGEGGREEEAEEMAHRARMAIERRLTRSSSSLSTVETVYRGEDTAREATVLLEDLKSIMWDNVGVVRTPSKLAAAVSDLSAIRDEADRLWEGRRGGVEAVALRDAAYAGLAVAEAALANRVSGGAHCIVLEEEDEGEGEEGGKSNGYSMKDMESDDEEEGLVVAAE